MSRPSDTKKSTNKMVRFSLANWRTPSLIERVIEGVVDERYAVSLLDSNEVFEDVRGVVSRVSQLDGESVVVRIETHELNL